MKNFKLFSVLFFTLVLSDSHTCAMTSDPAADEKLALDEKVEAEGRVIRAYETFYDTDKQTGEFSLKYDGVSECKQADLPEFMPQGTVLEYADSDPLPNNHTCNLCGKKFNELVHFELHTYIHTLKMPAAHIMRQRTNLMHIGANIKCPICKKKFQHKNSFKLHQEFAHKITDEKKS